MFTTQKTFLPAAAPHWQRTLLLKTNGGSVKIEALLDETSNLWVETETKSKDGAYIIATGNVTIRVTPTGGAVFDLI